MDRRRFLVNSSASVAGVEIPLSDQSWETRYHMNVLWDFADGSLFMGW